MSAEPDEIVFRADDRTELVACMSRLARSHDGWVNISPVLPEGVEPPRQGLLAFLGARGPEALLATWVPGRARRDGFEPTTVGLQHSAGKKVVARLADSGLPVPEGWRVTQDHAARGVVATVGDGADLDEVAAWLLGAAERVATSPLTGRWRATFHRST
ncbi:MAG: hypothetical protein ACR2LJ_03110 [Acidimicrobiales bacterium]